MSDQTRHFTYGTRKKMKGGRVYVCERFDIVGVPVSRWRASIPGNFGRAVSKHLSVPVEKVFLVF